MRWQSRGKIVALRRLCTTGKPIVKLGTKCASMTSTCSQSALRTASASSPSRAKSADRMLGAIIGSGTPSRSTAHQVHPLIVRARSPCAAVPLTGEVEVVTDTSDGRERAEHGVGALPMRPQLDGRTLPEVGNAGEARPRVYELVVGRNDFGHDLDGLRPVRRADDVAHDSTGPDESQRGSEQLALQVGELGNIGGIAAPSRLRPPAQRAKPRARRIEQHPVEAAVDFGIVAPIPDPHRHVPLRRRLPHEVRPMWTQLVGGDGCLPLRR